MAERTSSPGAWAARIRRVVVPARDAFRMYRGTATLLAVTAAVLLAATLPMVEGISRLSYHSVRGGGLGFTWSSGLQSAADSQSQTVRFFSRLLLATGTATFVVGALSVLTLCFARASAREGEIAVRRAVGASRRSLLAASLLEGAVVVLVAVLVGGIAGALLAHLALGQWPGSLAVPSWGARAIPGAALGALVLIGSLLPTVFARRERIVEAEATPTPFLVPALLQLGLSLIALTAGGLLLRQAEELPARAVAAHASGDVWALNPEPAAPEARAAAYATLLDRLGGVPGGASLSSPGVPLGLGPVSRLTTDCGLCSEGGLPLRFKHPLATHQFVSPDSFRILGFTVLAGRVFTRQDDWKSPRVAVVSRALAEQNFQNGDAVGRTLTLGDNRDDWYTVIGLVGDRAPGAFGAGAQPPYAVYVSVLQQPPDAVDLHLPVTGAAVAASVRDPIAALDPRASPTSLATLWRAESAPVTWFGRWIRLGGWEMLLIAAVGLFSFVRIWVLSLQPELGVRRAMGATRGQILVMVLRRATLVGGAGLAMGLWFGPALWGGLGEVLPGAPAWDAPLLLGYGASLVATTVLGALWPAWDAARRNPAALLASTGE